MALYFRIHFTGYRSLAGVERIELPSFALEANILPLDHTPRVCTIALFLRPLNPLFLAFFFMGLVRSATFTEFTNIKFFAVLTLSVATRMIVIFFTFSAL